tara:strand:+ start:760 stop:954 length:195 start_codon:yes stop_codon:yes gene_type:complete
MKSWDEYLESGYIVVLDNDGWWFTDLQAVDEDGCDVWEGGGDGPYGKDLLEHLLNKHYNGMVEV